MNCSFPGCSAKATGGMRELVDAASFDSGEAVSDGGRIAWCAEHVAEMSAHANEGEWVALTPAELR